MLEIFQKPFTTSITMGFVFLLLTSPLLFHEPTWSHIRTKPHCASRPKKYNLWLLLSNKYTFHNTFQNLKWKWKTTDYRVLLFWNKSEKVLQTFLRRCIQGPFFMCGTHKSVQKGWFHAYGLRNMFKVHSQVQTCSVCGSEPKTSRSSWHSLDKVSSFVTHIVTHKKCAKGWFDMFWECGIESQFPKFQPALHVGLGFLVMVGWWHV